MMLQYSCHEGTPPVKSMMTVTDGVFQVYYVGVVSMGFVVVHA